MIEQVIVPIPIGCTIDEENSDLKKGVIKFKEAPKPNRFIDDEKALIKGYWIDEMSEIVVCNPSKPILSNIPLNYNVFATEKQAKSALAMARISQIMANDPRFGGTFTDEEWMDSTMRGFYIRRVKGVTVIYCTGNTYQFLSFRTYDQAELFLEENERLVRDYLMLD